MKLLVGSVFIDDSPIQQQWLELQLKFLKATTEDFDHVSVLWLRQSDFFFYRSNVIEPQTKYQLSEAHVKGLEYLLYYFTERMEEFDSFLILDSDAFPIKKNWLPMLLRAMEPRPVMDTNGTVLKELGNSYEIAAIVRAENLERRLHSSALFIRDRQVLPKLNFVYESRGADLKGDREQDIYLPAMYEDDRQLAFPLMRSNQRNIHPLACGIYYDMFYHHACGSGRPFMLRSMDYWKQTFGQDMSPQHLTRELMANPEAFVANLAGWSPESYPRGQQ